MEKSNNSNKIFLIRGATTSKENTKIEITSAVHELIDELITRNNLEPINILSIIFTATKDLNACFPASIARKFNGLDSVAFLDCQQMFVPDDVKFCIRLMAQVNLPTMSKPNHPYLRGASYLRPDRC
tara:strand:+ start:770 stop:1150 length:381 start_codon:yes stop_codon:yes gene_type:complete